MSRKSHRYQPPIITVGYPTTILPPWAVVSPILAAGRPTLYVGPDGTEVAEILDRGACGTRVANGDVEALAEAILRYRREAVLRDEQGRRARELFDRCFTRRRGVGAFVDLLEGSVQKAGDKVRINAQLIEATSAHHLWAEHFDRDLKDLFALQDEIVQILVARLTVKITTTEQALAMRKDTENMDAYDYFQRGRAYYSHNTRSNNLLARQMFKKAIELDPSYASSYAALGLDI